jgi:hypothetical protein
MLALTACGSGSTTTESTDSTSAPVADSTLVTDSTAVPVVGGGVVPVEPAEGKQPTSHEEVK